jgi:hypothetical protein
MPMAEEPGLNPMAMLEPEPPELPELEPPPEDSAPAPAELLVQGDGPDTAAGVAAVYGADCPLVGIVDGSNPTPDEWADWARAVWTRHEDALSEHMHVVDRCRRFRAGEQWLSRMGARGAWREPTRAPNVVRYVHNVIGPALDWRLQILTEQKPGFRAVPASRLQDPDTTTEAQARQRVLDHLYSAQKMPAVLSSASHAAQTDGVAFLHAYWNPDGGVKRAGEMATCVHPIDQVRVAANATASTAPSYWVLRETIPLAQAVLQHGSGVTDADVTNGAPVVGTWRETRDRSTADLYRRQQTVERFTVYCEPSRFVPNGLTLVTVGRQVTFLGPLVFGVVPVVRVTDGTKSPAFFPSPQMHQWLELQQALNAALSKWLENIRKNAGGRFIARANAIVQETLTAAMDSVIEVRSPGNIGDVVLPLAGFSVGKDTMDLISWALGRLEDLSGFTPAARGQVSGDSSGRAILAAKESLERHFAGAVVATAEACAQWGTVQLKCVQQLYDEERLAAIFGGARPDLVRAFRRADADGVDDVQVDAETMMPEPRSLKLFRLDDLFAKQVIDADEYRRRYPGASMDDIDTPNAMQEAYALRVVELIRAGQPAPAVLWQEDESIGQTVLERELILAPDVPPEIQQAAGDRWMALAQQAAAKMGPPPMAPGAPGDAPPPPEMDPTAQPSGLMPGPIAAAPINAQSATIADAAVTGFEQSALQ